MVRLSKDNKEVTMSWDTSNENKFIDGLGNWNPDRPRQREFLLRQYLRAAKNRDVWQQVTEHGILDIDKEEILNRIKSEIGK